MKATGRDEKPNLPICALEKTERFVLKTQLFCYSLNFREIDNRRRWFLLWRIVATQSCHSLKCAAERKRERDRDREMHVLIVPVLSRCLFRTFTVYLHCIVFGSKIYNRSQLLHNLFERKRQLRIQYLLQNFKLHFQL